MSDLQISSALEDFIGGWEGRELQVYLDDHGLPTVGIGHLIQPGEDFSDGLTDEQCDALFENDCASRVKQLNEMCTGPTTQVQFDALFSLLFNIGKRRFMTSTALRKHNMGYTAAAADAILLWDKRTEGGMIIQDNGLAKRRWAERQIYKFGDYSGRP